MPESQHRDNSIFQKLLYSNNWQYLQTIQRSELQQKSNRIFYKLNTRLQNELDFLLKLRYSFNMQLDLQELQNQFLYLSSIANIHQNQLACHWISKNKILRQSTLQHYK